MINVEDDEEEEEDNEVEIEVELDREEDPLEPVLEVPTPLFLPSRSGREMPLEPRRSPTSELLLMTTMPPMGLK